MSTAPGPVGPDIPPSPKIFPPVSGVSDISDIPAVHGLHIGSGAGVMGESASGDGIFGTGAHNGVVGRSGAVGHSGVWADNTGGGFGVAGTSNAPGGVGVFGSGGELAGQFEGKVQVNGNVTVSGDVFAHDLHVVGEDCAENFDVAEGCGAEPGSVMVINDEGKLETSSRAYDRRVAGVIAGGGRYHPGIILGTSDPDGRRKLVALVGKVFCKADAGYGEIEVGDMLTTSPTPGHAMKASDAQNAFGAVIGKALHPMKDGQGLIPILVALQ